jgi:predicted CoA-binding protein
VAGGGAAVRRRARRAAHRLRSILGRIALDDTIRDLLSARLTWAVVGCSPSPHRDSHRIAGLLKDRGNTIIPVNPHAAGEVVLGEPCRASVTGLDERVDVVDIFRRADAAGEHVDEAIAIGARAVWMQLGVIDHAAAERARGAGLAVVMDRCPAIEVRRLGI